MASPSTWPIIHAERKALAADLEGLSDSQWATPSLCDGWSVRDVLAHMTATAKMTPPKFFARLAGSGFRFNAMVDKEIAKETQGDTLASFKTQLDATTHPPGPLEAMLGENIVHAEDIRRPLGITHAYPLEAVTRVGDFYKNSNLLLGGKKRIAGLTLKATDTEWSTGSGPEVTGPAVALVLAIAGRPAAVEQLSGEGLATLKARM